MTKRYRILAGPYRGLIGVHEYTSPRFGFIRAQVVGGAFTFHPWQLQEI